MLGYYALLLCSSIMLFWLSPLRLSFRWLVIAEIRGDRVICVTAMLKRRQPAAKADNKKYVFCYDDDQRVRESIWDNYAAIFL